MGWDSRGQRQKGNVSGIEMESRRGMEDNMQCRLLCSRVRGYYTGCFIEVDKIERMYSEKSIDFCCG
jgi:hypothetical protein